MDKGIKFTLHLLNGETNTTHDIKIIPTNDPIGKKWSALLIEAIDNNLPISEPDRIYDLNDKWSDQNMITFLQEQIDIINEFDTGRIPFNLNEQVITRDLFNELHTYFENFMHVDGGESHDFYWNAPNDIQWAIRNFNVGIHRYEQTSGLFYKGRKNPKINISIEDRPTMVMSEEECAGFKWCVPAGSVVLKYCHHGKHLYDYWKDEDDHIGDKNIIPQFNISSDFKVYFRKTYGWRNELKFFSWMKLKEDFLEGIGIKQKDPMLTTGLGVVGNIEGDPDEEHDKIYGITKIIGVSYDRL